VYFGEIGTTLRGHDSGLALPPADNLAVVVILQLNPPDAGSRYHVFMTDILHDLSHIHDIMYL